MPESHCLFVSVFWALVQFTAIDLGQDQIESSASVPPLLTGTVCRIELIRHVCALKTTP